MIQAKIIADSVSHHGNRLTTMEVTFHRFILAEINTHRAFSRNSASSRARSVQKTIQEVKDNPAVPIAWTVEQRGMSGGAFTEDSTIPYSADGEWHYACIHAIEQAEKLATLGIHKSLVNRLLEPFMWHTAVITATEWDNFFAQRLALLDDGTPAAQPEMYELARRMQLALMHSVPTKLDIGEWHLPYITDADHSHMAQEYGQFSYTRLCQISVARCAGVSYLTQGVEGRNHVKDVALFERLRTAEPPHWSPFEHVATPMSSPVSDESHYASWYFDNFRGWQSYRSLLSGGERAHERS